MPEIVEPRPEFRSVTKAALLAALDDPDPANPIAAGIARPVTADTINFRDHVKDRVCFGRYPARETALAY